MTKPEFIIKIRNEIPEAKNFSDADIGLYYEMVETTPNMNSFYQAQDMWKAIMKYKRETQTT